MRNYVQNAFLVAVVAAGVGAAAWLFSSTQEKQYESIAQLEYGRIVSPELQLLGPGFAEPDIDEEVKLATEAANLNSATVADATARANPKLRMTGGAVNAAVNASPVRGTLVVQLNSRASTGFAAAFLAKAYIRAYLRLRREREARRALVVQKTLRKRLAALPPAEKESFQGAGLRNQISTLDVLRRVGTGMPHVVEQPRISSSPVTPKTERNIVFGVLFGLAVGAGLVALRTGTGRSAAVAAARRASAARGAAPTQRR